MTNDIPETTPLPHDGDNDPTMPLPRTDAASTEPLPTGTGDGGASGPQAAYGFGAPSPQTAQAAADQRAAAAEYAREAAANGYPGGLSAAKGPSMWTIIAGIAICMAIVLGLFLYNVDSIDIVFDPTVWLWVAMILVFGVGILLIVWTIAKEISKSRNAKDRTK